MLILYNEQIYVHIYKYINWNSVLCMYSLRAFLWVTVTESTFIVSPCNRLLRSEQAVHRREGCQAPLHLHFAPLQKDGTQLQASNFSSCMDGSRLFPLLELTIPNCAEKRCGSRCAPLHTSQQWCHLTWTLRAWFRALGGAMKPHKAQRTVCLTSSATWIRHFPFGMYLLTSPLTMIYYFT